MRRKEGRKGDDLEYYLLEQKEESIIDEYLQRFIGGSDERDYIKILRENKLHNKKLIKQS